MKGITLKNLEKICNGTLHYAEKAPEVLDNDAACVVIDSRLIEKDGIFIATKGEKVDGHSFIGQVFEKGALGVVCEKLPEDPCGPCILVEDSFKALTAIATFYRQQLDCRIVGITGSVGKTSTKELIASVLRSGIETYATEGNFNNEIGVPLTILKIRKQHKMAVVEMGINHFGEMSRLTAVVKPNIAVLTNIGECHLEALGDRDGVLKAKTEIFEGLKENAAVIVNGMDDKLCTIGEVAGKAPIRYAFLPEGCADGKAADYSAQIKKAGEMQGSQVTIFGLEGLRFDVTVPLPGKHMVLNALAATAVGRLAGLSAEQIRSGIESVRVVAGRGRLIKCSAYNVIDDCYNANPTSVKASIDVLCTEFATGRTAILGDMFELGTQEKELHAAVGRYAKEKGVARLIAVGSLSKNMADAYGAGVEYYESTETLLEALQGLDLTGQNVLVKASHGMHFEKVVAALTETNGGN